MSLIDATRVLNGSDRTKDQMAEFLSVDAYTGQFAYLDTTGNYVPLYSRDGTPLLLTEDGKDIAVIFDD
ncbi:MAG: hypothetical protein IJW79_09940, partial [Clostridia bacterium]|nr:hypothetical protein [Clostridia bacterium]